MLNEEICKLCTPYGNLGFILHPHLGKAVDCPAVRTYMFLDSSDIPSNCLFQLEQILNEKK